MSRYDGLIIPRSWNEYINKSDAATLAQALQLNNVLDNAPTENSTKGVRSGGVYSALATKQPTLTFDDVPTDGSDNPVKSNGIYDALATKQDTLTFDNAPTQDSDNPVKSGGIYGTLAAMEIPVGTIIAQYKKAAPTGYLYLDGSTFDAAEYPSLYAYLGNSTTLPDYREYALVGAEQNTHDTIADHDVYTEGQAKDDQLQDHIHTANIMNSGGTQTNYSLSMANQKYLLQSNPFNQGITTGFRKGAVTRGKRKAVFYYIKAVSIADIL